MECEEFNLPDWSPPNNPFQSEHAKRASSSIMECKEFILPDWSPPDDTAKPSGDDDDDIDDGDDDGARAS